MTTRRIPKHLRNHPSFRKYYKAVIDRMGGDSEEVILAEEEAPEVGPDQPEADTVAVSDSDIGQDSAPQDAIGDNTVDQDSTASVDEETAVGDQATESNRTTEEEVADVDEAQPEVPPFKEMTRSQLLGYLSDEEKSSLPNTKKATIIDYLTSKFSGESQDSQ